MFYEIKHQRRKLCPLSVQIEKHMRGQGKRSSWRIGDRAQRKHRQSARGANLRDALRLHVYRNCAGLARELIALCHGVDHGIDREKFSDMSE